MKYNIGDKIRIIKTMVFFCENNLGKVDYILEITDNCIILEKYGSISSLAYNCIEKVDESSTDMILEHSVYEPEWKELK